MHFWKLNEHSPKIKLFIFLPFFRIILVRKIKKSEDFLQIFGMWIVEEISEKSVKFRQELVKFQHESAQTLNNFDDDVWKIMKKFQKFVTKICWNIEVWAVQKHVNLADLVKSFPTSIYLQIRLRYSRERAI